MRHEDARDRHRRLVQLADRRRLLIGERLRGTASRSGRGRPVERRMDPASLARDLQAHSPGW
jgi:hypothetical protein